MKKAAVPQSVGNLPSELGSVTTLAASSFFNESQERTHYIVFLQRAKLASSD